MHPSTSVKTSSERIEALLSALTLEEKVSLCHGASKFSLPAIPRLGIPKFWMSDGPHGVRAEADPFVDNPEAPADDASTYLPTETALAATWNPDLASRFGRTLGEEARARGKDVILGPGCNILRTPLCGRNFEYLGEDPCLSAVLSVAVIQGVQPCGVAACIKHLALNNQELDRKSVNVEVDDRALREIYLPAFEAAVVRGKCLTVMGAYNRFRGQHCCHHQPLLVDILKTEWAFDGFVVSDWAGAHDTMEAALNGLDIEMGGEAHLFEKAVLGAAFLEALEKGAVSTSLLDDKVRRILSVMERIGVWDKTRPKGARNTPEHQNAAYAVAAEAMVLLKNEQDMLPLDIPKMKRLLVVGENAVRRHADKGGSSAVKALYEVTPLEGLRNAWGKDLDITYCPGYAQPDAPADSGGAAAGEDTADHSRADEAVAAAAGADAVLFIGGLNHDFDVESRDKPDLKLPYGQDALIERLVAVNPHTAVILVAGSPVDMPWAERVPAILQAWYAGMEGGNVLADVLSGKINPSGKLPFTIPVRLEDTPAHAPDTGTYDAKQVEYREGVFVGYRWHDARGIEPRFAFGHGLSYTRFDYSNLQVQRQASEKGDPRVRIRFRLTNRGHRAGAETAQLYVRDEESDLPRPPRELKAFRKVRLDPGKSEELVFDLDAEAFRYWHPDRGGWFLESGRFHIELGASSRDIRLSESIDLDF